MTAGAGKFIKEFFSLREIAVARRVMLFLVRFLNTIASNISKSTDIRQIIIKTLPLPE
jgi:hypothetical protein